ncbi:universal stress protein [Candidatus Chloroploca sp. Khr17]|uniref:universal stress protein n=1 Tax=Candidatus Chloroploca sp. Khr17 TaxID=2496869 RepID=UPI0013EA5357|nr:universal stress protein [Candidatus Chloroploca sp. Khr17]
MFERIAFATDGSAVCERALDYVASLAHCYAAHVLVLNVAAAPPVAMSEPYLHHALQSRRQQAAACVDGTRERLRALGVVEVEMVVLEGPPAEAILEQIAQWRATLLVIGAHGEHPWRDRILGSVSLALTQRAPCPVLVMK